jgi:CDP-glucose 4,6-dehydratase
MRPVGRIFSGKRVIVTGHTGFKGAWLSEWLLALGAEVYGFSLPAPTEPSLFDQLGLAPRMEHRIGDVRDEATVAACVRDVQPDFVFHLAAQALVRRSYADPLETFTTNVTGTAQVLAALRSLTKPCAVVIVTSDKCYTNHEAGRLYREGDALGGRDPYSASKAAAELVTASWREAFLPVDKIVAGLVPPVGISTARAGNVIGGGDWAQDRIVPDSLRALAAQQPIRVRNPTAIRPWQHVLEPLGGYLLLAEEIYAALLSLSASRLGEVCGAFNFGPSPSDHRTVRDLVEEMIKHAPGAWEDASDASAPHEAKLLHLATDKARTVLGWAPRWGFETAVAHTIAWYQAPATEAGVFTRRQIHAFAQTSPA